MGNFFSINKEKNIKDLNFIVSFYLFKMNWKNVNNLLNKKYCDKLLNIVGKLLVKYYGSDEESAKLLSKVFIKIAHIYSSILININPVLVFDSNKKIMVSKLKKNINIRDILLEPNCEFQVPILDLVQQQLKDLDSIYYDEYSVNDRKFNGKTDMLNKKYLLDKETFFEALLSDLSIINLNNSFEKNFELAKPFILKNINTELNQISSSNLLTRYGRMIKTFLLINNEYQNELVNFYPDIFKIKPNHNNEQKEEICINDTLTDDDLDKIVHSVRGIILNLNLKCNEFNDNLAFAYEALIESTILSISKIQIESLEKSLEEASIK